MLRIQIEVYTANMDEIRKKFNVHRIIFEGKGITFLRHKITISSFLSCFIQFFTFFFRKNMIIKKI